MATPTPPQFAAPVLSQKQRRAALRKERRKRKRQALAQARECGLKNGISCAPEEEEEINDEDDEETEVAEAERLRFHEEWLEKERLAQEEFRLKCEREEAVRKRKEEEERMIKEEWEAQQRREQEEKEQRQQEKRGREEAVQKMLDEAEKQLDNGGQWMNPEAPVTENSEPERDVANCPFFLKTGACRFGDRCSRKHVYPTASPTLMVRGMFVTFGMEESRRDDYDIDAWLEHSEEELQESFVEFYRDVLPEFRSIGKVVQFKVSCNYEPHLRGNVYIQFDTEEQCKEAFFRFNGRWYAGRQLHCEICPVTRWKNAICGLFDRQKCPKGKHCNFLHVFRNPGNEFWEADRDLHMSPDRTVRGSRRDGRHSERYGDRSWRQRHCSRSPPRSERSHSGRDSDRWRSRSRSRSRERRASHQHRDDKWSSRSRHSDGKNDWYLNRNRDRSRSRSRDREPDRLRNRSRDKDRHKNRSEERDSRDKDTGTHRKERARSRSSSREEDRNKHSREQSPKKTDKKVKTCSDDTSARRRHKQSKKSKKKSKKKHKKKSRLPDGATSSEESDKDEKSKEVPAETLTDASPVQKTNETELISKNNDMDVRQCVDSEKTSSPGVKSEGHITELE